MAKQEDEKVDLSEIPPIGGLVVILLTSYFYISWTSTGNVQIRNGMIMISLLSTLYFLYRFFQIGSEQGIGKSFRWMFSALEDRKDGEFVSPLSGLSDAGTSIVNAGEAGGKSLLHAGEIGAKTASAATSSTSSPQKHGLEQFRSMDEYEFEHLVADVWQKKGWDTTVTQGSNDAGIDIIAEKDDLYHKKILIQAKRYSKGNNVGSQQVQQYYSLKDQEDNVDEVLIVTTSDFTDPARELAEKLNVKLINGPEFYERYTNLFEDGS